MNLGDLVTDILDEINKGAGITADQVKSKVRDALSVLEIANSWAYMDRFVEFTINLDAEQPRVLPVPTGLKSIEFIRFLGDDGEYEYVTECNARDIAKLETGLPARYFKDGMEYLWLDKTPAEAYEGEMSYRKYTNWSSDNTFEPWIFKYFHVLVKYQTLIMFAPFLREPEQMAHYEKLLSQSLKAAVDANEELEYSNQPASMQYS